MTGLELADKERAISMAVELALSKHSEQAINNTMNNPLVYVCVAVLVAVLVGAVSLIFTIIFNRIKKNEHGLEVEQARNIVSMQCLEDKLSSAAVHKNDCNGKQELWGERFDNMMDKFSIYLDQNEREHSQVISVMEANAKASASQIADFAETIAELSDCVKNLELGKEC